MKARERKQNETKTKNKKEGDGSDLCHRGASSRRRGSWADGLAKQLKTHLRISGGKAGANQPCILCSDDYLALQVLHVLRYMGLEGGKDVPVAGYGGNETVRRLAPMLTTMEQDTRHIGRMLARKLIEEIEYPFSAAREHVVVQGNLRRGNTVQKK